MIKRIYILIGALFFSICFMMGQNTVSKKELKERKRNLSGQMKLLKDKGKLDSLISYTYNLGAASDNSIKKYKAKTNNGSVLQMVVVEGDTLYVQSMKTFSVVDLKPYGDPVKDREFRRLRYHVKKVYPYAKVAADKLILYNEDIAVVKSKRKKRKLMKLRENALKQEFEGVIKKMSRTSGRVLVKLIDRETGESTYDIIKEMRGRFKAWTYQGVGKLYGANLKQRYNPETNPEDEMIERVVQSLIIQGENIR